MRLIGNEDFARCAAAVERYFFPRRLEVPTYVNNRLSEVYPTVDWEEVDFYRGWPHVMCRRGFQAITLPDPHSVHRINVYFTDDAWRPDTRQGMATIIHEGYHVLQVQEMGRYGAGLVRPFTIAYLAGWAGCGFRYSSHPMEHAAYGMAGHPSAHFERGVAANEPGETFAETDLSGLAQDGIECSFWQEMDRAIPAAVRGTDDPSQDESGKGKAHFRGAVVRLLTVFYALVFGTAALLLWLLFLVIEGVGVVAFTSARLAADLGEHA